MLTSSVLSENNRGQLRPEVIRTHGLRIAVTGCVYPLPHYCLQQWIGRATTLDGQGTVGEVLVQVRNTGRYIVYKGDTNIEAGAIDPVTKISA